MQKIYKNKTILNKLIEIMINENNEHIMISFLKTQFLPVVAERITTTNIIIIKQNFNPNINNTTYHL